MSTADVSVVIPAYRAGKTIGRALASVAAQSVKPREVVVVDDGSDDGTYDAASACAAGLGTIGLKLVRQENKGAGAARNRALAECEGRYVAFLDADDEWLPEKLERSLAHFTGEPEPVLVAHNGWIVGTDGETLNDCAARHGLDGDPFHALYRRGYIDTCTVVARRDAVVAAGGFDPDLRNAQDFDLWLAMLCSPGTPFVVFDQPLARYYLTGGSIMTNTARRLACCLQVARRYAPHLRRHPGSPLRSLCFRVLAVHYEAMTAYRARGRTAAALGAALRCPFALIAQTVAFLGSDTPARPDFLASGGTP